MTTSTAQPLARYRQALPSFLSPYIVRMAPILNVAADEIDEGPDALPDAAASLT